MEPSAGDQYIMKINVPNRLKMRFPKLTPTSLTMFCPCLVNLNNIYLENNQNIQYIKHSKYRQDCFLSCFLVEFCQIDWLNVIHGHVFEYYDGMNGKNYENILQLFL